MMTVTTTAVRTPNATTAAGAGGQVRPNAATDAKAASTADASTAKVGGATVISLSAAARGYVAKLGGGTPGAAITDSSATAATVGIRSLDEIAAARTEALAGRIGAAFKAMGIPQDDPITLKLDALGQVKTDSPYKTKIETLFKDDPDLAKDVKDVAGLNAMKAAQKALEAFAQETKDARNDDARDAASGRYTKRLMTSQALSGTMTLEDGKLRSASVSFMERAVGETAPPEAGTRAQQVAARRTSRSA